jgi:hypothetical protein
MPTLAALVCDEWPEFIPDPSRPPHRLPLRRSARLPGHSAALPPRLIRTRSRRPARRDPRSFDLASCGPSVRRSKGSGAPAWQLLPQTYTDHLLPQLFKMQATRCIASSGADLNTTLYARQSLED